MTFKYLPYFICGYCITFKNRWETNVNWQTILSLFALIFGGMFVQLKYPSIGYNYAIFDYLIAFPIIYIIYIVTSQRIRLNANRWYYQTLLKNNFGIYLFHPMIIYVLFYLQVFDSLNTYTQIALIFCIAFMLSVVFTLCVNRTKIKFIIGD